MNAATREIIIPKIRDYFRSQPIERAWIFGSFCDLEEDNS